MIALCDCNNFYVSCERVFNPSLEGKPVVVLSNNDGCIISRSNEVKELGIKMAQPAFYIKDLIKKHNIQLFSSNYTLYGDMSQRVMNILSGFTPLMEIYSIDEAFLDFTGITEINYQKTGDEIITKIKKWTGIPVSIGFAQTKTLAKIASKAAKRNFGVYSIDSPRKHDIALKNTSVADLWGVGGQYASMLAKNKIYSAYDFTLAPDEWIRKNMTVMGLRTKKELLGIPCIRIEDDIKDKKAICTSRAFGKKINSIDFLREAVATYATRCAEKLRKQYSQANILMVFIHTDPFNKNEKQYRKSITISLPFPTNDNQILLKYALMGLEKIFSKGYAYKKAGVIVDSLEPDSSIQGSLFDDSGSSKKKKLMESIDVLNSKFGRDTIRYAILGDGKEWKLRQEKLSGRFTTRWEEILSVSVKV
ncbi:MAG: SOS mutagenesis and repair protein UmuC [Bacteroidetes bacterium GWF2_38_335]|nr:MAG: SOS mutagenesis and repair protein UmuC [Bacteroidetes bacterium GWF2_38_335]HBS88260.1 SOS mutagenesis and repair protein UmuC [Bacteroidales bacterium]